MDEKLIRQIVFVILGIVVVLGVLSLVSTLVQMIVPLAVLGIGGFAFYKIVLEGRDEPDAMEDEVAETSAMVVQGTADPVTQVQPDTQVTNDDDIVVEVKTPEETQQEAEERLSAVEKAQRDYVDNITPAEEILEQLKARKQRLQGDDQA